MFPRFKINFRSLEGVIMISNICLLAMQLRCNQNDILDYSHCIYNERDTATRKILHFFRGLAWLPRVWSFVCPSGHKIRLRCMKSHSLTELPLGIHFVLRSPKSPPPGYYSFFVPAFLVSRYVWTGFAAFPGPWPRTNRKPSCCGASCPSRRSRCPSGGKWGNFLIHYLFGAILRFAWPPCIYLHVVGSFLCVSSSFFGFMRL